VAKQDRDKTYMYTPGRLEC